MELVLETRIKLCIEFSLAAWWKGSTAKFSFDALAKEYIRWHEGFIKLYSVKAIDVIIP